ncbi:MAG: hypothetical protein M3345_03060, partial [Actinomycetota bacterium]|nr:hypothetical protein [Actinomycetota bacterium]
NRVIADAQGHRPHPRSRGRTPRILYAVQAEVSPPTFLLFATARLETNYLRYIENVIRKAEPFDGTPIRVGLRLKTRRELDDA